MPKLPVSSIIFSLEMFTTTGAAIIPYSFLGGMPPPLKIIQRPWNKRIERDRVLLRAMHEKKESVIYVGINSLFVRYMQDQSDGIGPLPPGSIFTTPAGIPSRIPLPFWLFVDDIDQLGIGARAFVSELCTVASEVVVAREGSYAGEDCE
jgi:hypothetical protein